ncbi:protein phosphatase 2A regulatory subunit cdc55 [Mucor velutinosus]|uniref:Protein phosphatase 2A regulatory subunit cdc55 n=1 Tax=Mucor velutinosus TaxID=708070 RepID=A0AAN7DCZ7_9FUNG|nr:protein phosphatase 2A regulatory subunit cdc55 [Mucor velutinosus]
MDTQRSTRAIDNDLYHLHTDIQLRDVENNIDMSLDEKEQLKAILISIKEIDGNISYPIFQEIFQNSMGYRTANDQEQLLAYMHSSEQEVLDTAITESVTVVPESHQADASTTGQRLSNESSLRITTIHPLATKSQATDIKSHLASDENHLRNIECHSPSTGNYNESVENHAAMDSALSAVNDIQAPQPKKDRRRTEKYTTTITLLASLKGTCFTKKPLQQILLPKPITEMQLIKAYPQRGNTIFRMRMEAINEPKSAEEKAFLDTFDVQDVMQVYRKPLNEFIGLVASGYQSHLNKCRQMLHAYQIGKITEQLLRESSHKDKEQLEKSLFHHLKAAFSKNSLYYHQFIGLCVNSMYLVEHVGVHVLFVPEVVSPAILRGMDAQSLMSLAKYLADEWPPQFRKIGRLTCYGEVVVSRGHTDDSIVESEETYPGHFLSSF